MKKKIIVRYYVKLKKGHCALFGLDEFNYRGPDPVPLGEAWPLICRLNFEECWRWCRRIENEWDTLFPEGHSKRLIESSEFTQQLIIEEKILLKQRIESKNQLVVTGFWSFEELGITGSFNLDKGIWEDKPDTTAESSILPVSSSIKK